MKILTLSLCMVLLSGIRCWAEAAEVRDVRAALQNRQFEAAVELVDSLLAASQEDRDFLFYLKGLSLFYNKNFSDAIGGPSVSKMFWIFPTWSIYACNYWDQRESLRRLRCSYDRSIVIY